MTANTASSRAARFADHRLRWPHSQESWALSPHRAPSSLDNAPDNNYNARQRFLAGSAKPGA